MKNKNFAFGKENYRMMFAGIGVLLLGFILMSLDKEDFGFGFIGLTLGPIVLMLAFVSFFYAILKKPSRGDE